MATALFGSISPGAQTPCPLLTNYDLGQAAEILWASISFCVNRNINSTYLT